MPARPYTSTTVAIANPIIRVMSRIDTGAYRVTGGRLGNKWLHGEPILLLTVTGRKSGRRLTFPLIYLADGERVVVAASKGGMDEHPLWYRNLVANPDVEVQIGTAVRPMRARSAEGAERAQYWSRLVALNPDFTEYQARTERSIPVVVLSPR